MANKVVVWRVAGHHHFGDAWEQKKLETAQLIASEVRHSNSVLVLQTGDHLVDGAFVRFSRQMRALGCSNVVSNPRGLHEWEGRDSGCISALVDQVDAVLVITAREALALARWVMEGILGTMPHHEPIHPGDVLVFDLDSASASRLELPV